MTTTESKIKFWTCQDLSDFEIILEISREAHLSSRFSHVRFSEEKLKAIVERSISSSGSNPIFLAGNAKLAGAAYCSAGDYYIGQDYPITTVHAIYVSNSARRTLASGRISMGLMRGIKNWSQKRGSKEIWIHATSGIENKRMHAIHKRIGLGVAGFSYMTRRNDA